MARKRLARLPRDWNSLTVLIELFWRPASWTSRQRP